MNRIILSILGLAVLAATGYWFRRERFDPPPAWASFFSPRDYHTFIGLVQEHFSSAGESVTIHDGTIVRSGGSQLGLENLAQVCNQNPQNQWGRLIDEHFAFMTKTLKEGEARKEAIKDYKIAEPILALRIAQKADVPLAAVVSREDLPGTVTYLSIDFPDSVMSVSPDLKAGWHEPDEAIFSRALANIAEKWPVTDDRLDLEGGLSIRALTADHFYVPAHALLLDRHSDCVGKYGAVVAIPTRNLLLAYPINDLEVIQATKVMALVASKQYQTGPGSTTAQLYYCRDGRFIDLPYEISSKEFVFRPPNSFVELLNHLPKSSSHPTTSTPQHP